MTHLIGTRQASRILDCSPRTVQRLVAAGVLTPAMIAPAGPRGTYLFDQADVEAYAATLNEAS